MIRSLFETAAVHEAAGRLARLTPQTRPLWGTMTAAQMMAHCSAALGMAEGKVNPPRIFLGRLLGSLAKRSLIGKGEPMRRNVMTEPSLRVTGERDFLVEMQTLRDSIEHFASGGPALCTRHPHFFFGPLTPEEWAMLMYQHLDHHLRQFGV